MLKITAVPKEATCTFMSDYLWPIATGELYEIVLLATF